MRSGRPVVNITDQMQRIIDDLCARLPAFAHIEPQRVLVCLSRARQAMVRATYAKIIPMRFPGGSPFKRVEGHDYALPQIPTPDGDVLYLIYLYLPRFFEQPFERRLLTLIHELYHIAPAFDGTIRRIGTRAHGASREEFNARLDPLVQEYLEALPPEELLAILRADLCDLSRRAALTGRTLPLPKAVRLG